MLAQRRDLLAQRRDLLAQRRDLMKQAHLLYRTIRPLFVRYRVALILAHLSVLPAAIREVTEALASVQGERLTLMKLGRRLGRSPWHLNVVFRQQTGLTIHEFATCLKMNHALSAIRRGAKIEAVACELGYRSTKSFYRQFESLFSIRPTEARRAGVAERFVPRAVPLATRRLHALVNQSELRHSA
jgi:AraC-like DNA-binding protein